jgi:hypothetical protein
MSSSLQLKQLILRFGYKEICNDMKWLLEIDEEIKRQYYKERIKTLKAEIIEIENLYKYENK